MMDVNAYEKNEKPSLLFSYQINVYSRRGIMHNVILL